MKDPEFRVEWILNAYVDNELDHDDRRRTLLRIETDEALGKQVCELQRTKEWVKFSFADEKAPTRTLPKTTGLGWSTGIFSVAASILVLVATFTAGWLGHSYQSGEEQLAMATVESESRHVILHIGKSDDAQFSALLDRAKQMLDAYTVAGIQVEVVTNAGGLDMVRTAESHHVETIRAMIAHYDNVRFIACSKGLNRLRQQGKDVELIQGVSSEEPAANHLIQRLTEGWTLIKI